MTVVIGAISDGRVYLAGDSYLGDEDACDLCSEPKVVQIANTVGIGICGDVRAEAVVVKTIKGMLSKKQRITDSYLRGDFSIKLHEKLKASGVLKDDKGITALDESEYLLGHAGSLYYVEDSLGLWRPRVPYAAIGSGRTFALGALAYANMSGDLRTDPKKALKKVLDACVRHCHHVRPPYTFLKI
jgi:20S proteasome alpha/beta subunit